MPGEEVFRESPGTHGCSGGTGVFDAAGFKNLDHLGRITAVGICQSGDNTSGDLLKFAAVIHYLTNQFGTRQEIKKRMKFTMTRHLVSGIEFDKFLFIEFTKTTQAGVEVECTFETVAVENVDQFGILNHAIVKTEGQSFEKATRKHVTNTHKIISFQL